MKVTLSKEEQTLKENEFTSNLILFWLKSNFILTNKRILGKQPNTVFGLIPLGYKQIDQPLKTIASITCSTKFFAVRFFTGLILALVGFAMLNGIGLPLLIIGTVYILNSYATTFVIVNNGGVNAITYQLSILEKDKVQNFVTEVNTQIAEL